ncbi:hypothetical protein J3459_006166 [Metarhizium acridum]|nr:hypothetical protein J3459_006166 [Metarhizium acridum]
MAGEEGTTGRMECLEEEEGQEEDDEDDEDDVGQQRRQRQDLVERAKKQCRVEGQLLVHSVARKKQMELQVQKLAVNEQLKLRAPAGQ